MGKKEPQKTISVRPDALAGKHMIITGEIEGQTRKSAQQILINAGAIIEKSLNKSVELVVLGEDAGPKKLEKIEQLGLETTEWEDLIADIGDGDEEDDVEDVEAEDPETEVEEAKPIANSKAKVDNTKEKAPAKEKAAAKEKAPAKEKVPPKPKATTSSGEFSLEGKTVIITGTVPGHDRKSSQKIVEDAGAKVAKSLNKSVELAILGDSPGPDKLSKIEDMGIETIKWNDMAEKLGLDITPEKEVADVEAGDAPDSIEGVTLIVTGSVEGLTRSEAQKILESAGAKFAKSLNKSVELVVLGANPGPDKLNKISDLGIPTCSFEALAEKLGLETDAPPKKKQKKA